MAKSVRWGLIAPVASWICCRQGYSFVGAPPDVHGRCAQVRVLHGPQGARYFPRCWGALLVVAYVTVWARVVGLRASRWACYCVSIVTSRPPGLAGCIVPVAELADALDLGSSAFGRVGSTPTGRTSGGGFRSFLLPLAFRSCYDGWDAVRRVSSIWQNTSLVNWSCGFESHTRLVWLAAPLFWGGWL